MTTSTSAAFRTADDERRFGAAYDAALARWPVPVTPLDVPTQYGTTRVNAAGRPDRPPLLLLSGGGATSASWWANVGALVAVRRVYAVDHLGDAGRSVPAGRPMTTRAALLDWLTQVLDGLGVGRADVCGHSYGGWQAAALAVHAPGRVGRLALLDPTSVFGGFAPRYLLRAAPMLLRPTEARVRRFLAWETGGPAGEWADLQVLAATAFRAARPVPPRRPDVGALSAPLAVLVAGRSRSHDPARVARQARELFPSAVVEVLPGATHHSLPWREAAAVDDALVRFLD
ncbi:alpha/beta fold hydrolase [Spirilliplanes yamanashiensis]|nr:alpha/beta fold hydrolase [Spirilliplanes yamanashiensis]MDP9818954.1 pimeloyl-ACP methyl ester carboxylesterase [Spirilliplanes yamanashiensis]